MTLAFVSRTPSPDKAAGRTRSLVHFAIREVYLLAGRKKAETKSGRQQFRCSQ